MKTMLVVDGNSILNRAFYGVHTLTTVSGLPTNAVYGMITMLRHQTEQYAPEYCAVAFDMHAPTFRHKMYDRYKSNRKGMPEELAVQLPYARRAVEALGFTVIEKEGFEADDILGTCAALGERTKNIRTLIMTGDRDSLQLISDTVSVLLATNNDYVLFDRAAFAEKYGVQPEQFVDVKAIMGDSSDCIPGVPGIGEKGALTLIAGFGSLDQIYQNLESPQIKPSMRQKLAEGKESAYLSQTLARIIRDVPGIPAPEEFGNGEIDSECARALFTELEFSGLIKKMGLDHETVAPGIPEPAVYETREGTDELSRIVLGQNGAAIAADGGKIYAYDGHLLVCTEEGPEAWAAICGAAKNLCCFDCKKLYKSSDKAGITVRGIGFDIMLAAYVLDPQGGFDLPRIVTVYLNEVYSDSVPEVVYVYRIKDVLSARLENANFSGGKLFREIEMPLAEVLADMENAGFLIDREGLFRYGEQISAEADAISQRIFERAGEEFNLNSPKQLGEILFEKMGLPAGKKTKTGYSTNAEILEKLAPYYPVVADILEYRKLTKLYSTYVVGLLKEADENGKVHTTFNQTGTATGRLSSSEPNLQNIPIKTDEGRELRKYFLPAPGHKLIDADYSQIELRLLAAISGDENMTDAFVTGKDIHTSTASAVFGVPPEEVTPLLRKRAKAVNFGIVYGIGDYSLSQDLHISVKQARDYIESYMSSYPAVSAYLDQIVQRARSDGFVDTLYGRRRYIPEINAKNAVARKFGERVAMNSPIQGTAADIIKIAMINVSRRLAAERLDARLILQVHDELIIEAAVGCAERAAAILKEEMEKAADLPVPLTVEINTGDRWYET